MTWLGEDVPGLEAGYKRFLKSVSLDTENAEWNIRNHPARQILNSFPPGFGVWVSHIQSLNLMKRGGYLFGKNDLTVLEWKALAIVELFQKE